MSTIYSRVCYHCEFPPLQLEILSKNYMFVLMQVVNQDIYKMQNSRTRDLKGSNKNMNHVDVRLIGL